jgi:hypothetical protein
MKTVTPLSIECYDDMRRLQDAEVRSRPSVALYVHSLSCLGFVLWCHITRNAGDVLQCYV